MVSGVSTRIGATCYLSEAVEVCELPAYGQGSYTIHVLVDDQDMSANLTGDRYVEIGAGYDITITSPDPAITITQKALSSTNSNARHFYIKGSLTLLNITLDGNYDNTVTTDASGGGGIYITDSGVPAAAGETRCTYCTKKLHLFKTYCK